MAVLEKETRQVRGRPEERGEEDKVFVWPHLVRIEMIGMLLYLVLFALMSIFINAPLRNLANPEVTPNPAKAPWYFLGLQELLLHMHPALAGVIVPGAVLVGLAMIPYFDTDRRGSGIYFSTPRGARITIFSFVYTTVWEVGLILLDAQGVEGVSAGGIAAVLKRIMPFPGAVEAVITDIVVPTFLMLFIPAVLALIVKKVWKANTREIMIALFSFFVASFVVLTLVGSAFRGHSMKLFWPWEVGPPEELIQ